MPLTYAFPFSKLVRRYGYSGLLVIVLLALGVAYRAEAQTTSDVQGAVQLRLSGGLRLANPEYADLRPFVADVYDQRFYGQAEADVALSRALSISAAFIFLRDNDRYAIPCIVACPDREPKLRLLVPEARVKYHRRQRRSDLYAGIGAGYGFGRLTDREAADGIWADVRLLYEDRRTSASGPSFSFFTGFAYNLTRRFAFFGEIGYRSLKTDFSSEDDTFNPSPYRFTGPFSSAGVGLTL